MHIRHPQRLLTQRLGNFAILAGFVTGKRIVPLAQSARGLFFTERPLVESQVEQERIGLSHEPARGDVENSHNLFAVQVWAHGLDLFALRQFRNAALEVLTAAAKP